MAQLAKLSVYSPGNQLAYGKVRAIRWKGNMEGIDNHKVYLSPDFA